MIKIPFKHAMILTTQDSGLVEKTSFGALWLFPSSLLFYSVAWFLLHILHRSSACNGSVETHECGIGRGYGLTWEWWQEKWKSVKKAEAKVFNRVILEALWQCSLCTFRKLFNSVIMDRRRLSFTLPRSYASTFLTFSFLLILLSFPFS